MKFKEIATKQHQAKSNKNDTSNNSAKMSKISGKATNSPNHSPPAFRDKVSNVQA